MTNRAFGRVLRAAVEVDQVGFRGGVRPGGRRRDGWVCCTLGLVSFSSRAIVGAALREVRSGPLGERSAGGAFSGPWCEPVFKPSTDPVGAHTVSAVVWPSGAVGFPVEGVPNITYCPSG